MIWAAGVMASPAAQWLGAEPIAPGASRSRPICAVPGRPSFRRRRHRGADRRQGPARSRHRAGGKADGPLCRPADRGAYCGPAGAAAVPYRHLGNLATIGRKAAVVKLGGVRADRLPRLAVLERRPHLFPDRAAQPLRGRLNWLWNYVTFQRGARLIGVAPR